jgi:hypothetical protein
MSLFINVVLGLVWVCLWFFHPSYEINLFTQKIEYKEGVTVVITSRRRHDLLNLTLSSFFKKNDYPIEKVIIVEDGVYNDSMTELMDVYSNCTWLMTGQSKDGVHPGQLKAIDMAYSLVETEWVFHSEDDWQFIEPGFIKESMEIMKANRNVINTFLFPISKNFDPETQIIIG